jgi:hypothetical protein
LNHLIEAAAATIAMLQEKPLGLSFLHDRPPSPKTPLGCAYTVQLFLRTSLAFNLRKALIFDLLKGFPIIKYGSYVALSRIRVPHKPILLAIYSGAPQA